MICQLAGFIPKAVAPDTCTYGKFGRKVDTHCGRELIAALRGEAVMEVVVYLFEN